MKKYPVQATNVVKTKVQNSKLFSRGKSNNVLKTKLTPIDAFSDDDDFAVNDADDGFGDFGAFEDFEADFPSSSNHFQSSTSQNMKIEEDDDQIIIEEVIELEEVVIEDDDTDGSDGYSEHTIDEDEYEAYLEGRINQAFPEWTSSSQHTSCTHYSDSEYSYDEVTIDSREYEDCVSIGIQEVDWSGTKLNINKRITLDKKSGKKTKKVKRRKGKKGKSSKKASSKASPSSSTDKKTSSSHKKLTKSSKSKSKRSILSKGETPTTSTKKASRRASVMGPSTTSAMESTSYGRKAPPTPTRSPSKKPSRRASIMGPLQSAPPSGSIPPMDKSTPPSTGSSGRRKRPTAPTKKVKQRSNSVGMLEAKRARERTNSVGFSDTKKVRERTKSTLAKSNDNVGQISERGRRTKMEKARSLGMIDRAKSSRKTKKGDDDDNTHTTTKSSKSGRSIKSKSSKSRSKSPDRGKRKSPKTSSSSKHSTGVTVTRDQRSKSPTKKRGLSKKSKSSKTVSTPAGDHETLKKLQKGLMGTKAKSYRDMDPFAELNHGSDADFDDFLKTNRSTSSMLDILDTGKKKKVNKSGLGKLKDQRGGYGNSSSTLPTVDTTISTEW